MNLPTKRDEFGFPEGDQPVLSEAQWTWLATRLDLDSDAATNLVLQIPAGLLSQWLTESGFARAYSETQSNKREAFRFLGTQMLGKAILRINRLLESDNEKAAAQGIQLLLRSQALLIDRSARVDRDAVTALVAALRAPVNVLEGEYREIGGEGGA